MILERNWTIDMPLGLDVGDLYHYKSNNLEHKYIVLSMRKNQTHDNVYSITFYFLNTKETIVANYSLPIANCAEVTIIKTKLGKLLYG